MTPSVQSSPFLKQLTSSHKKTRDEAYESLQTFLRSRKDFAELELLQIWKGIFYCMYMQDKPLTQQRLAISMASLVDTLPRRNVMPFLDAFWATMAREWRDIDRLRMDKFLFLIRQYLAASFRFCARHDWRDDEGTDECIALLRKFPLNLHSTDIPDGLRYHVLDTFVDELDKVDEAREGKMPLDRLLEPVRKLAKESYSKGVRKRAKETLEDERLADWNGEHPSECDEEGGEDDGWGGIED